MNGNEDMIGEGRRKANKHKKPHKSRGRHMGNGRDLTLAGWKHENT